MRLHIFHPETNEFIEEVNFLYTPIDQYLERNNYPDKCYFHIEPFHAGHWYYESRWGKFYKKGTTLDISARSNWVVLHPDNVPECAKARLLLIQ